MEIIKIYSKKDTINLVKLEYGLSIAKSKITNSNCIDNRYVSRKDIFKYISNERKLFCNTNTSEVYDIENCLINNNVAIIDPPYSIIGDFINNRKIANIGIIEDNEYISYDLNYCLLCLLNGYCDYILVDNNDKYFPAIIVSNRIKRYILRKKSLKLWSTRVTKNKLDKISNKEFTFNVNILIGNKHGNSILNISDYNIIDFKDDRIYDDINTEDLSKEDVDCLRGLQFVKQKYSLCQVLYSYDKKYITTAENISMVLQDITKYIECYNKLYDTKEPLHLNKWSITLLDTK